MTSNVLLVQYATVYICKLGVRCFECLFFKVFLVQVRRAVSDGASLSHSECTS